MKFSRKPTVYYFNEDKQCEYVGFVSLPDCPVFETFQKKYIRKNVCMFDLYWMSVSTGLVAVASLKHAHEGFVVKTTKYQRMGISELNIPVSIRVAELVRR